MNVNPNLEVKTPSPLEAYEKSNPDSPNCPSSPSFEQMKELLKLIQQERHPTKYTLQQKSVIFLFLEKLGTGNWNSVYKVIIPEDQKRISKEYTRVASMIDKIINLPILKMDNSATNMCKTDWFNTAESIKELLKDSFEAQFFFYYLCKKVIELHENETQLHLGSDPQRIIKTPESLCEKITSKQQSTNKTEKECIAANGDTLRATIITTGIKPIYDVVQSILKLIRKKKGHAYIKNFYKDSERYPAIHIRMRFSFAVINAFNKKHKIVLQKQKKISFKERFLQMEIQVHPQEIMKFLPITHAIYKDANKLPDIDFGAKLLFLMAMKNLMEEYEKGFSRKAILAKEWADKITYSGQVVSTDDKIVVKKENLDQMREESRDIST